MIALVIVSHSAQIAQGAKTLADQMSQGRVQIFAAGGVDDETIGTNVERIHVALKEAVKTDGVLVLFDLGSALMSAEMAIDMLTPEEQERVMLSDAPLVEGVIIAAIEASTGQPLDAVAEAARAAGQMNKLS